MTKQVTSKYTPEMEARITEQPVLNQAVAEVLAKEFKLSTRSVIAKITRMGLPYERKAKVTKTGAPVEQKEAIVAQIAELTGLTLDGLDKAPKPALQALRDFVAA